MGYTNKPSAQVYKIERDGNKTKLVPIGSAWVGDDGVTLGIEFDETVMIGPDMPLVVKGI